MAAVDDAAWLQLISVQRLAGFNLPPTDPARPGAFTATAILAERDMVVARFNLAIGGK
jgi:hypothetical protein